MNDLEIEKRFKIYLDEMCGEVGLPCCTDCEQLADVTDLAEGAYYCKDCLKKSLLRDMDFFIKSTNVKGLTNGN